MGKGMALNLARKGLDVIITYNSRQDEAHAVTEQIRQAGRKAAALQLNAGDAKSFDAFVQAVSQTLTSVFATGTFDFIINNAGVGHHALFAETKEEDFDNLLNLHFKGPFFLTQKLLPLMNDGGGIVNISTGLARFTLPNYSAYASMKGAMETLTKYQAKELGVRKIRSNIVAPGAIATDFSGGLVRDNAEINQHIASATALGRVGLPEDIGAVVAFLCTDEARWVNAQRIEVSGGQML